MKFYNVPPISGFTQFLFQAWIWKFLFEVETCGSVKRKGKGGWSRGHQLGFLGTGLKTSEEKKIHLWGRSATLWLNTAVQEGLGTQNSDYNHPSLPKPLGEKNIWRKWVENPRIFTSGWHKLANQIKKKKKTKTHKCFWPSGFLWLIQILHEN